MVSRPSSGLISIEAFISQGLSASEVLTLRSVRLKVTSYNCRLASDLIGVKNAYQKYGNLNTLTNEFEFYPSLFVAPRRSELLLQEKLAHTQLFVTFVSQRRNEDMQTDKLDLPLRERSAKLIACWIYCRWLKKGMPQINK